jgi:hypothetical protein
VKPHVTKLLPKPRVSKFEYMSHPLLYSNFAPPKNTLIDKIGITKQNKPYSQSNVDLCSDHHILKDGPYIYMYLGKKKYLLLTATLLALFDVEV